MPPWMIGCSIPNISVIAVFTSASDVVFTDVWPACCPSVDNFEKSCGAHAAAHAHGDDGVFGLAPATLDQGVAGQARSGHAVGMANRDRAAIDVELFRIDPELIPAMDDLHCECLVQFPEIDIFDLKSVTLEKSRY